LTTRPVNVIVVELPALFRDLGIGVIWSPQTSVPKGTMLRLNLGAGTAALEPDTGMPTDAPQLCKGEEGPVPSAAAIVSVLVANQPVRLELDTGATKLGLSGNSPLAKALQQAPGVSAGERVGAGGAERTLEVPPQELKLAGQTYVVPVSMTSNADPSPGACSADGEIGLEVLQNCIVDISVDRCGVRCSPARQAPTP